MRIIYAFSCENYGVIPVIFREMVSKNSSVVTPFQQKFKCHSSKISCAHCNYSNAVFRVYKEKRELQKILHKLQKYYIACMIKIHYKKQ